MGGGRGDAGQLIFGPGAGDEEDRAWLGLGLPPKAQAARQGTPGKPYSNHRRKEGLSGGWMIVLCWLIGFPIS